MPETLEDKFSSRFDFFKKKSKEIDNNLKDVGELNLVWNWVSYFDRTFMRITSPVWAPLAYIGSFFRTKYSQENNCYVLR